MTLIARNFVRRPSPQRLRQMAECGMDTAIQSALRSLADSYEGRRQP